MEQTIDSTIAAGKDSLQKAIDHLRLELSKIRAGKASPAMLSGIMVPYYGNPTQLTQVANVGTPDARTLSIQPWEKNMLAPIEQAIFQANLGLTPMNDGEYIRITIPPLTEERRKDLTKQTKALGEDSKIAIRSERHKVLDFIKKEVKEGYPEDAGKRREAEIEQLVKDHYKKVEDLLEAKEKEIMTV
jgi:ribosome recycling factor